MRVWGKGGKKRGNIVSTVTGVGFGKDERNTLGHCPKNSGTSSRQFPLLWLALSMIQTLQLPEQEIIIIIIIIMLIYIAPSNAQGASQK